MFDPSLALLVGLNVDQAGAIATASGGPEEIAIIPIEIVFPDLGHAGFLGRMRATFSFGWEFESSEIERG
jgi:hypothetical protein